MNTQAPTIKAAYSYHNAMSEKSSSRGRISLLRLNELCKKLRATIILGNFVTKPYWLIVFRKYFSHCIKK